MSIKSQPLINKECTLVTLLLNASCIWWRNIYWHG